MNFITLFEGYDWLNIVEEGEVPGEKCITPSQLQELEATIASLSIDEETILWGNKQLKFINYVGFIQCETFAIELLPKISIAATKEQMREILLVMLNECGELDVSISELTDLSLMQGSLLEIFGHIYAKSLVKELHRGIIHQYALVQENLLSLKGSLMVSSHIRENISRNQSYRAYCEFEERIVDHELNQLFVAANCILHRYIRSFETMKILKQIDYMLDGVSVRSFANNELDRIKLDRTTSRYKTTVILAKHFLRDVTGTFSTGDSKAMTLLFKMNDLFEMYIAELMKQVTIYPVFIQHTAHKLLVKEENQRNIFQLKPDIVVDAPQQVIIDTKWKRLTDGNRSGVKREDLFQMYAYLTRYENAKAAILLYPQTENVDPATDYVESWLLERDSTKKLRVHMVPLNNKEMTLRSLEKILTHYIDGNDQDQIV
ncbi:hypothetical protein LYSIN_00973 [Lysinibacillus sphaericus]|uniref:5-methylcytosine-specific restriction enzyme subunit McrC n=1 Tax=Lysinibacillus sphaericus TaxID=1421 RepID=A0A2S5CZD8_LYSSH|nr:hypothetical protein [Lysinibacillus sphaericus]POZ56190.1 hypothetical protein LYSIN_00973 [Lysinibacillus sphaericus]